MSGKFQPIRTAILLSIASCFFRNLNRCETDGSGSPLAHPAICGAPCETTTTNSIQEAERCVESVTNISSNNSHALHESVQTGSRNSSTADGSGVDGETSIIDVDDEVDDVDDVDGEIDWSEEVVSSRDREADLTITRDLIALGKGKVYIIMIIIEVMTGQWTCWIRCQYQYVHSYQHKCNSRFSP